MPPKNNISDFTMNPRDGTIPENSGTPSVDSEKLREEVGLGIEFPMEWKEPRNRQNRLDSSNTAAPLTFSILSCSNNSTFPTFTYLYLENIFFKKYILKHVLREGEPRSGEHLNELHS